MLRLNHTLHAWGTPDFEAALKQELAQHAGQLPLQQGLATGNYVSDAPITAVLHHVVETERMIHVTVGIFYQGVVGGCSCADDPMPPGESAEYCEVQLDIDKTNAATAVTLVM